MPVPLPRRVSAIRRFLNSQASSGIILMAAAALAPLIANSLLREAYAHLLHIGVGSLSLGHAINDGLMAIFFLLVGLEIKREMLDGQLSSWPRRLLPGIAALGGTICPALVYLAFNRGGAVVRWCGGAVAGWAIPAAADIAFALAVIMLVGDRASMRRSPACCWPSPSPAAHARALGLRRRGQPAPPTGAPAAWPGRFRHPAAIRAGQCRRADPQACLPARCYRR